MMAIGVILRAIDEVTAPLKNIGASVANFQNKMTQSSAKLKGALAQGANAALVSDAADKVKGALVEPLKQVIDTGADFEQAMSKLRSATGGKLPVEELQKFATAAQDLGIAKGFKPEQVVTGMTELAKAGLNAKQVFESIPAVLDLTAAGDIALGDAATIASDTMSQFNLEAKDMGRISNVLVAAADASTIGVKDLAETFKYAAPAMASVNQSLEETAALTALLGSQGIKGSMAGTGIKNMVGRLSGGKGMKELNSLGVRSHMTQDNIDQLKNAGIDTSKMRVGDLRKVPDILADISAKTKDMGTAKKIEILKKIFGEEGYGAALKIMDLGSEKILDMTKEMSQSGIAQAKAAIMTGNLRGEQAKLSAAFDVLSTSLFTAIAPALTWLTSLLKDGVAWAGAFLRENQGVAKVLMITAGAIAAVVAIIGPLLAIGATMQAAMGLWSVGIAGLTGAFGVIKAALLGLGSAFAKVGALMMANPVIAVIAAVAIAALLIYMYWDQIRDAFWKGVNYVNNLWESLGTGTKVAIAVIGVALYPFLAIPLLIIKYWEPIKTFFVSMWQSISEAFTAGVNWISSLPDRILGAWQKVKDFFASIGAAISSAFGGGGEAPKVGGAVGQPAAAAQPMAPGGAPLATGAAVNQSITTTNVQKQEVSVKFENAPKGTKMDTAKSKGNVQLEMGYSSVGF